MPEYSLVMPADPVGIYFLILLFWVPAAWVYVDAEERGLSAYLWGGLTLLGSVITLIFYYRHRARVDVPDSLSYRRGRIYMHVALLTFYGVVFASLLILLGALIDYVRGDDPLSTSLFGRGEELRRSVALVVALLVIAVPLLAVHYEGLRRRVARGMSDAAARLDIGQLQRALVSVVVLLSSLLGLLAITVLVFEVTGRLFDVGGVGRDASTFGMSALIVSVLSLAAMYLHTRTPLFQRG